MSTQSQTATYKGRKYRLVWMGATKYGQRAKLQFFDGSREFWADAAAVSVVASHSQPRNDGWRGNGCSECRRLGDWCERCAFDEFDC